jgi:type II secretory ATPase GspE/PulE/Tfp pilus assembly ATPase PilB-like protein
VNVIIAQRLVRKICEHCRVTVAVTKELIAEIERQMKFADIMAVLTQYGEMEKGAEATDIHFYRGKGCAKCGHRGYKGRIGIYEILEITPALSGLILKQASPEEMMKLGLSEGLMTMAQDGFLKAKQGLTSIEEILRVTKE